MRLFAFSTLTTTLTTLTLLLSAENAMAGDRAMNIVFENNSKNTQITELRLPDFYAHRTIIHGGEHHQCLPYLKEGPKDILPSEFSRYYINVDACKLRDVRNMTINNNPVSDRTTGAETNGYITISNVSHSPSYEGDSYRCSFTVIKYIVDIHGELMCTKPFFYADDERCLTNIKTDAQVVGNQCRYTITLRGQV